jgi:hypothetical protein
MSLNLVLSCCNKECLSLHALSKFRCRSNLKFFLRLNTRSLDKSLQMTTLVNFAISPKNVGKPKHFRDITHCQQISTRPYTTFVGIRNNDDRSRVFMSRAIE